MYIYIYVQRERERDGVSSYMCQRVLPAVARRARHAQRHVCAADEGITEQPTRALEPQEARPCSTEPKTPAINYKKTNKSNMEIQ